MGLIRCGDAEEEKQQYGEQPEHGAAGRALKPHWGPLGKSARRFGPVCSAESIHLLIVDEERKLNASERVERELGVGLRRYPVSSSMHFAADLVLKPYWAIHGRISLREPFICVILPRFQFQGELHLRLMQTEVMSMTHIAFEGVVSFVRCLIINEGFRNLYGGLLRLFGLLRWAVRMDLRSQ